MDFLAHQFGLRRLTDKVRRRMLRLLGRPDNTPWILDGHFYKRTSHVDFMFALDYLSLNSRLLQMFHQAMKAHGVSTLLVNHSNIEKVRWEIENGWTRPYLYLDLCSRPGDDFEALLLAAAKAGAHTVAHPGGLAWARKAHSHPHLQRAGLPVPRTVIFHAKEPDRELTEHERQWIGDRCVIKPSCGFAGQGVVAGVTPTKENIAAARNFNRNDDWLVQQMVRWTNLGQREGYLRAYYVFGHRTLLWWHALEKGHGGYAPLTWEDFEKYDLFPAVQYVERIAELSGMEFFSTEIAITNQSGPNRFRLIDYINDQCDMDPAAHPRFSPPEVFCHWVCERFAERVWRLKYNLPEADQKGLFLL